MLILTRLPGEKIYIGDNITVSIREVTGKQVKIAVDAPREIEVHREEVYHRRKKEELEACATCKGVASPNCVEHAPLKKLVEAGKA